MGMTYLNTAQQSCLIISSDKFLAISYMFNSTTYSSSLGKAVIESTTY